MPFDFDSVLITVTMDFSKFVFKNAMYKILKNVWVDLGLGFFCLCLGWFVCGAFCFILFCFSFVLFSFVLAFLF